MHKIVLAGIILAVAVAVYVIGAMALVAAGGIAAGFVLGEFLDFLGADVAELATAAPTRRGSRRDRDE